MIDKKTFNAADYEDDMEKENPIFRENSFYRLEFNVTSDVWETLLAYFVNYEMDGWQEDRQEQAMSYIFARGLLSVFERNKELAKKFDEDILQGVDSEIVKRSKSHFVKALLSVIEQNED